MKKYSALKWVPSLYFAEGLPNIIVAEVSVFLYQQLGLSAEEITFYTSWFYLPWVLKPLWSPFVDVYKTKRWWILAMELLLGAAFAGVAFSLPTSFWLQTTICLFWLIAFSSATHDIAADGFYMLGLDTEEQSWFVGIRNTFYKFASIFGKGILISFAGILQVVFKGQIKYSWTLSFYAVAALFLLLYFYHYYSLPRPFLDHNQAKKNIQVVANELLSTIVSFFKKPHIGTALLFLLLYRFPEALLSKVSILFLRDFKHAGGLGLAPQEFSMVYGTLGVIGLLIGGIIGGMLVSRDGLKRWLWWMVCAITIPDIVYVYLSTANDVPFFLVNVCVFIEQLGYGFGFTAYTLYMLQFCRGKFQTSHYAISTGFMAASMMIPGMISGFLQHKLGYQNFFIMVMFTCIITFVVTSFIKVEDHCKGQNKE